MPTYKIQPCIRRFISLPWKETSNVSRYDINTNHLTSITNIYLALLSDLSKEERV